MGEMRGGGAILAGVFIGLGGTTGKPCCVRITPSTFLNMCSYIEHVQK